MFTYLIFFLIFFFNPGPFQDAEKADSINIPTNRLLTDTEFLSIIEQSSCCQNISAKMNLDEKLKVVAEYFKNRKKPNYFWQQDNIKDRIKNFVENNPKSAQNIIQNADRFIETFGIHVDWKLPGKDLKGREHTPNTIRYLARQASAVDIAMSYYITGNEKYVSFLKGQMADFITSFEQGKTQSGKNDVFERFYAGRRLRNWLFMYNILKESSLFSTNDHIFMIKVFLLHGAKLYETCKKFHWGNHQLHGLEGLYEMTIMYPEIPVMRFWNSEAMRVIMEHISREVKEDGLQFERASHYFKFDIINYFRIYAISRLNNIRLAPLFNTRFEKMFEAIIALSMPTKKMPVLQDAQELYEQSSNDIAELPDPTEAELMSIGSLLFKNSQFKYFADTTFPSNYAWFFPKDSLVQYSKIMIKRPELGSVSLDSSAYYIMRSGWQKNDLYLIVDGGLAKYKPDHTHGGVLSVILHAFDEDLLPAYRVHYSDPSYRTMKNSLVKNVALADNILQGQGWISNTSKTGFGIWQTLPKPLVQEWISGFYHDYFRGTHNGFEKAGVKYERSIVFIKPFCWLVFDDFHSNNYHSYQQIWQGNYTIDSQYNKATYEGAKAKLNILQADPSYMKIRKRNLFGKHSIEFEKKGVMDYSFLTLLYPDSVQSILKPDIRLFERKTYKQVLIYAGKYQHAYYFNKTGLLKLDELSSDAKNILLSYKSGVLSSVFFYQGRSIEVSDLNFKAKKPCTVEFKKTDTGKWSFHYLKGPEQELILNTNKINANVRI